MNELNKYEFKIEDYKNQWIDCTVSEFNTTYLFEILNYLRETKNTDNDNKNSKFENKKIKENSIFEDIKNI